MEARALEIAEYKLFCRAVMDACCLLGRGDDCAGYRCLAMGAEHIRELSDTGQPWVNDLADSYLTALECYALLPAVSRRCLNPVAMPEQLDTVPRGTGMTLLHR